MRTIRFLTSASLGILLLVACARVAPAQTYIWTDEHGVVHAAAEPGEVPAKFREKALHDASNARHSVTVVPGADAPVPAAPRASPVEAEDAPTPEAAAGSHSPKPSNPEKKYQGKGLPPPDEGFEWHCANDPEGGPPKCEQLEKKNNKRNRRADARKAAREALGVGPTDEFDPEVAKRVDKRTEEEFKKTTPVPTTKAPKRSENGDDDESDSAGDSEE